MRWEAIWRAAHIVAVPLHSCTDYDRLGAVLREESEQISDFPASAQGGVEENERREAEAARKGEGKTNHVVHPEVTLVDWSQTVAKLEENGQDICT